MSVEKSAPSTAPLLLQPRLQPRSSRTAGFENLLAASLDRNQAGPLATTNSGSSGSPGAPGIAGGIGRPSDLSVTDEVRGTVDRQAAAAFGTTPGAAQAQAVAMDSAAPAGATRASGQTHGQPHGQTYGQTYGRMTGRMTGPEPGSAHGSGHGAASGSGHGAAAGSGIAQASGHSRTSSPASSSSQFTPEEASALRYWASVVNAPPRPQVHHAKAPSLDGKPSEVAAAVAASNGSAASDSSAADIAATLIGKRYVVGGESPRQGFDCSGLTSYAYAKTGTELPRNSRQQFHQGQPVDRQHLRKGDLVFFGRRGVQHVGIYAGDGNFIHAASGAGQVHESSLDDPVWSRLYAGARRVT